MGLLVAWGSVLLLFRGSSIWGSVSVPSSFFCGFPWRCFALVRLLLSPLPSLPYSGASLVLLLLLVAVAFLPVCPAPCLGGSRSLSLASVRLGYCAVGLLLRSCPIVYFICIGFLGCVLLGRRFLASLDSGLAFILVHLLCDSVESQFLHDGVLPLGRVCSVSCCFCLFPVWAVFVLLSLVLFMSWSFRLLFLLLLVEWSARCGVSLLWVPLLLSLFLRGLCLPVRYCLKFLLFFLVVLSQLSGFFYGLFLFLLVLLCCYVPVPVLLS